MTKRSTVTILLIFAALMLAATTTPTTADVVTVSPSRFDSLGLDTDSYWYLGDSRFVSSRSCRVPWIYVTWSNIRFNRSDSTLTASGSIYDGFNHTDLSSTLLQMLVGPVTGCEPDSSGQADDSSDIPVICLDIQERADIENNDDFTLVLKVHPHTWLCIAPRAPDLGPEFQVITATFFEVGKLLTEQTSAE